MSQLPCSHIEAIIQQITQDLQAIYDQLHALEVEGLNLLNPWPTSCCSGRLTASPQKNARCKTPGTAP